MKGKHIIAALAAGLWAMIPVAALAQKLAIGEKAPEIRVERWLDGKPQGGRARLLDFFHSSSKECIAIIPQLDRYAADYAERLEVIVIAREPEEKAAPFIKGGDYRFYPAIDEEGKTFAAFGVQYVPYGVLIDRRGRVVWFGNTATLTESQIEKAL